MAGVIDLSPQGQVSPGSASVLSRVIRSEILQIFGRSGEEVTRPCARRAGEVGASTQRMRALRLSAIAMLRSEPLTQSRTGPTARSRGGAQDGRQNRWQQLNHCARSRVPPRQCISRTSGRNWICNSEMTIDLFVQTAATEYARAPAWPEFLCATMAEFQNFGK